MRELSLADFSASVGSTYRVDAAGRQVELTLDKTVEINPSARTAGSFRLELRGPAEPLLEQAIYRFHQDDEVFEIFIVPVAQDSSGIMYEAIFN